MWCAVLSSFLLAQTPTHVGLASAQNPAVFGRTITLTAFVWTDDGSVPTGNVSFFATPSGAAEVPLGSAPVLNARADYDVRGTLVPGEYALRAAYAGDAAFGASSASLTPTQLVTAAGARLSVTFEAERVELGADTAISVIVSAEPPGDGTPDGEVVLYEDATELGRATIALGGARFSTQDLRPGQHVLRAEYLGEARFSPAVTLASVRVVRPIAESPECLQPGCCGQTPASAWLWIAAVGIVLWRRRR
ncbi:MAG: Ig-like domain repeat protein [Deltaproteobacteria bacterium]|nr:Ig-like domain repeat protein [Deltaproteobacteria bacterium]